MLVDLPSRLVWSPDRKKHKVETKSQVQKNIQDSAVLILKQGMLTDILIYIKSIEDTCGKFELNHYSLFPINFKLSQASLGGCYFY